MAKPTPIQAPSGQPESISHNATTDTTGPSNDVFWEVEAELHPDGEELWSLFCYEAGASGAEWVSEGPERWVIRHFFENEPPPAAEALCLEFAKEYPLQAVPTRVTLRSRPIEPWSTAWQAHFQPLEVGEKLLILPPWEKAPDQGRLAVVIEPGQGFGTGWHASTAMALTALEILLSREAASPPARMVDVGAGSGILAIASCHLGVGEAVAVDVDGVVHREIRRNFVHNHLPLPLGVVHGGPECLRGEFPLVVANIVAAVLLAHCETLCRLTAPGGWLILSGVLDSERSLLRERYDQAGMQLVEEVRDKGWCAFIFHKKEK